MDPRLLNYYNRELQHVRDMGAEFAREFPKIAGRLGLDEFACQDPYVERLFEGFAFLAARVQLKIDAEFPEFAQYLLETIYPDYLAPIPSMTVVQFNPDLSEGSLAQGISLPRDTLLQSQPLLDEQTRCEYRLAHAVTLWPLQLTEAEYLSTAAIQAINKDLARPGVRAGLRLRLRTTASVRFNETSIDRLAIYLMGSGDIPYRLYEQLLANTSEVVVQPAQRPAPWREDISIRRMGFHPDEALLPSDERMFQGYRLLREYFSFPERFLFVEFNGLDKAIRKCQGEELDIIALFDRNDDQLIQAIDASHFALHCAPAINVFMKRSDRIMIDPHLSEFHIVPDRTRPADYEVYGVREVIGYAGGSSEGQNFLPFYGSRTGYRQTHETAFHSIRRQRRLQSGRHRKLKTNYLGSEVFISLVDAAQAPYRGDLKQIGLTLWCTNRDLPLLMPVKVGDTDFTLQAGAPVQSIRCLAGPTKPRPSSAEGNIAWRLINHLSLNYLSLADTDAHQGAAALRDLLSLYGDTTDHALRKQIEGVQSIKTATVVRRVNSSGPIVFGRGLEITLKFDESAFEGSRFFLLGAVLEHFFSGYTSINSFTETAIHTTDRGEVMRWPARIGQRHIL